MSRSEHPVLLLSHLFPLKNFIIVDPVIPVSELPGNLYLLKAGILTTTPTLIPTKESANFYRILHCSCVETFLPLAGAFTGGQDGALGVNQGSVQSTIPIVVSWQDYWVGRTLARVRSTIDLLTAIPRPFCSLQESDRYTLFYCIH